MEHFEGEKQKAVDLQNKISKTDAEIDKMVYELYGLSDEEIKIIEEINDPGLFEIRQALANEIVSLQQVSHLDYQGLYLKLNALISSLDKLKQTSFLRDTLKLV